MIEGTAHVELSIDGKRALIDGARVLHVRTDVEARLSVPSTFSHILKFQPKAYDELLGNLGGSSPLWFRVRVGVDASAWSKHFIKTIVADRVSNSDGTQTVCITAGDHLYKASQVQEIAFHQGHAHEIIENYFESVGVKTQAEPTNLELGLFRSNQSFLEFVQKRILPVSLTVDRQPGFSLFCRNDVVHFRSLMGNGGELHHIDLDGVQGKNFVVSDASRTSKIVHVAACNPLTGACTTVVPDLTNVQSYGSSGTAPEDVERSVRHTDYHSLPYTEASALNRTFWMYGVRYKATVIVKNRPLIELGDTINIIGRGSWSGLYSLISYNRLFIKDTVTTSLELGRASQGLPGGEVLSASPVTQFEQRGTRQAFSPEQILA